MHYRRHLFISERGNIAKALLLVLTLYCTGWEYLNILFSVTALALHWLGAFKSEMMK